MTPSVPSGVQTLRDLADQLQAESARVDVLMGTLAVLFGHVDHEDPLPEWSRVPLANVRQAYEAVRDGG